MRLTLPNVTLPIRLNTMTDTSREVADAQRLLEALCSEDFKTSVLDARSQVTQCQRSLLLEVGQIQLKVVQEGVIDTERKKFYNRCMDLVECYLIGLECALSKIQYIRELLDLTSDNEAVQSQMPYQKMLAEMMLMQRMRSRKLLADDSGLHDVVNPAVFDTILEPFQHVFL